MITNQIKNNNPKWFEVGNLIEIPYPYGLHIIVGLEPGGSDWITVKLYDLDRESFWDHIEWYQEPLNIKILHSNQDLSQ